MSHLSRHIDRASAIVRAMPAYKHHRSRLRPCSKCGTGTIVFVVRQGIQRPLCGDCHAKGA